jgi:hypothetical protein
MRSPLAVARPPESGRRSLGGGGPVGARAPRGGGVATASLAVLARPGGHRLGGDRPHRCRHRDRDEMPGATRGAISPGRTSRRYGCPAAGEGGTAEALWQCCASFVLVECSGRSTACWWSRSIAWRCSRSRRAPTRPSFSFNPAADATPAEPSEFAALLSGCSLGRRSACRPRTTGVRPGVQTKSSEGTWSQSWRRIRAGGGVWRLLLGELATAPP